MNSSSEQATDIVRGITHAEPGDFEIQDITGTLASGSEDEMRTEWMETIERDLPTKFDELKLVEVKAVIRK